MNPIDISSSDSELDGSDLDVCQLDASATSTDPRILPMWASTHGAGHGEQFQKVLFPKRTPASNGSLSNIYQSSRAKLQKHPGSSDDFRVPNSHITLDDYSNGNGYVGQPTKNWGHKHLHQIIDSKIAGRLGGYEKHSSRQALRTTLPTSLQPLVPSGCEIREACGKSYDSAWPNITYGMNSMKDNFSTGMDDEVVMYVNTGSRVLPASLMHTKSVSATHGTSLMGIGYGGPSQKVPFPKIASASNGSSSNIYHNSQAKFQTHPSSSDDFKVPNLHIALDDNSKGNGYVVQPTKNWGINNLHDIIDSKIAGMFGTGYGELPSQQALKRTLPTSFQPSVPAARSSNLVENVGSSQIREACGKSYHSAWPNITHGMNSMKDHFSRGNDDEVFMYVNPGSRVLPPSVMHTNSVSAPPHVTSSDPVYHSRIGEERAGENEERLIYEAALRDLDQPKVEATLPDGLLSVSLLRHQKIALAWMLHMETSSLHCLGGMLADDQGLGKTISMIALIQMQKFSHSKSKSEDPCSQKAEALNLDDDDDDNGMAGDKARQVRESDDFKRIPERSTSTREFHTRRPAAGTLVVCPASVLRQWARELDEKVADEAKLSVLVYHGSNRTKDAIELANYDVVLTTYSIVTNEVPQQPLVDDEKNREVCGLSSEFSTNKKRKKSSNVNRGKKGRKQVDSSGIGCYGGTLARVVWCRVILDEAQIIKNHRTQVARACCGLRAKRRWCLSGTPIQNAIEDLFSYFRFLRYDPYAIYVSFCHAIKFPISRNSVHGYKKLQAVLKAIMLRRTKGTIIDGKPILNLPPKTICLIRGDFSAKERAFYSELETNSRSQFKEYDDAGTVSQNYANILVMLLRLRQACDHPLLVKGFSSESVGRVSVQTVKGLPRDLLTNLFNLLETSLAICCVCNDPPEDAVISICGHIFCYQCVSEYLTGDDNMCPSPECKEQLGADVVYSKATLTSFTCNLDGNHSSSSEYSHKPIDLQNDYNSSKIRAAIEILQSHCKSNSSSSELHDLARCNGNSSSSVKAESDSGVGAAIHTTICSDSQPEGPRKAIVFSQWTSMLDLVEISLDQSRLQYRRLDGTMSLTARDKAVKEFNTDPEVTVMLMSLKAGNLGLNMVAASHVILLDLWWNPTTEDQAIDRAHRIGQTRPVTVSRMTIKDTVEDRILDLQKKKREMVASAFGEDQGGGSATRLTVEDLRFLFMV